MRVAALPVGAASKMRSRAWFSLDKSAVIRRATMVVLPVPGPPAITAICRCKAKATATVCQLHRYYQE